MTPLLLAESNHAALIARVLEQRPEAARDLEAFAGDTRSIEDALDELFELEPFDILRVVTDGRKRTRRSMRIGSRRCGRCSILGRRRSRSPAW